MIAVCLYFQAHQPHRLRPYNYFDVGREHRYFDAEGNAALLSRVAEKCYLPATDMLLRLLDRYPGFAVAFSVSGCLVEQLRKTSPAALDAFRSLAATGRAEFLAETSHHSLAWLASQDEFARQVALHREIVAAELHVEPRVFRNTELIYSDDLARFVEARGYSGVLADGVPPLLGDRSPHFVYRAATPGGLPLLLRDSSLSDDIAFRFSNREWIEYPLTAEKYDGWIAALAGDVVSLFMDFETLGEHQWRETGIFDFFEAWVERYLARPGARFLTPSQAIAALPAHEPLSAPRLLSWADEARDVSAWQGNELQRDALRRLFRLEGRVAAAGSPGLAEDFRRLTTSDLYYYMGTKTSADGEVHAYFSPYDSPYDAYMNFMHVVSDLERRLPRPSSRKRAIRAPTASQGAP